MWAVICEARMGHSSGIHHLALVDRQITRQMWWTSDNINIILGYRKRSAADFACGRLHRNNPQVVPLIDAIKMIEEQANEIDHHKAMEDAEAGWDGHKMWRS